MSASKVGSWYRRSSNGPKMALLASRSSIRSFSTGQASRTDALAGRDLARRPRFGLGRLAGDRVPRLRLGRRHRSSAILHVERGHCLGIAAVEVLVLDDPAVVERGGA